MRRLRGEGADSTFKGLNEGMLGTVGSWEMRRESPEGQIVRHFFYAWWRSWDFILRVVRYQGGVQEWLDQVHVLDLCYAVHMWLLSP